MKIENYNGKQATKFLGIKIDNELVVVDESAEIKKPCFLLSKENIIHSNIGWNYGDRVIISASQELISKYSMSLPIFVSKEEQEIEDSATNKFKLYLNSILNTIPDNIHNELWNCLFDCIKEKEYYKANQNRYSEEDLRKFIRQAIYLKGGFNEEGFSFYYDNNEIEDKVLQSLNQREVWLEVEKVYEEEKNLCKGKCEDLETRGGCHGMWDCKHVNDDNLNFDWQLKLTNNNQVIEL